MARTRDSPLTPSATSCAAAGGPCTSLATPTCSTRWASWGSVDVALLPIWGWGRTLGAGHLNPRTAVDAVELIQPGLVVPIHWGTYAPVGVRRQPPGWLDAPVHQFEASLAGNGEAGRLRVLGPGDELIVPGSPAWPSERFG